MLTVEHHSDENYLLITKTGLLSLDDTKALMLAVKQHPVFCPQANRLYDLSHAILDWGMDDINHIIAYIQQTFEATEKPLKIAMVNSDSTEQTLVDLFVSLAERELDRNFCVFSTVADAQQWIIKPRHN
jgi:hypothetical protein